MSHHDPLPPIGTGRISFGPTDDDGLVPRTLEFIRQQLPAWRDDPRRPKKVTEKGLNSSLCDFLDVKQRQSEFAMVRFKHEVPQAARTTVDLGVHGLTEITTVGTQSYGIYDPFLVIECKRLPTPGGRKREREYVSGFHSNGSPTGGIQRFKLGLHGGQVEVAAMIGTSRSKTSTTGTTRSINGSLILSERWFQVAPLGRGQISSQNSISPS